MNHWEMGRDDWPEDDSGWRAEVVAEIDAQRRLTGVYGTYPTDGPRYVPADDPINDGKTT